jgi:hypothetical protein
MSTVNVKFFRPAIIHQNTAAVMGADIQAAEVLTSSGTSAVTTGSAPDGKTYIRVVATGNVWVAFGTAPVAVSGAGTLVIANIPEVFKLEQGHKVAVID